MTNQRLDFFISVRVSFTSNSFESLGYYISSRTEVFCSLVFRTQFYIFRKIERYVISKIILRKIYVWVFVIVITKMYYSTSL